jgi:integrase
MPRNPHSSIALIERQSRLYLQFPRGLYGKNQKCVSLKIPDNRQNRLWASGKIEVMEADRRRGQFDRSLKKYLVTATESDSQDLTLSELWERYCNYKQDDRKAATMQYLRFGIGQHIRNCPHQTLNDSIKIKSWLSGCTSRDMTRRILRSLATAVKWGQRHGSIESGNNPFLGMAEDMQLSRAETTPNAFSNEEMASVIQAFDESRYYASYAHLVRFLFLTGCRPSEAIGLEWEQISGDCDRIRFDRSIVHISGKPIRNQRSKTNRIRVFPCQPALRQLLIDLSSARKYGGLVFQSPNFLPIDYKNFSQRGWAKVVEPVIGRPSTPYSCRDSFITMQISKGIPIALVARWVDNSVEMIERYYFDPSALSDLRPR